MMVDGNGDNQVTVELTDEDINRMLERIGSLTRNASVFVSSSNAAVRLPSIGEDRGFLSSDQATDWKARQYRLFIYGKDEKIITSIMLSPEQADALGKAFCPRDTDGTGDYDLDCYVQMGPG